MSTCVLDRVTSLLKALAIFMQHNVIAVSEVVSQARIHREDLQIQAATKASAQRRLLPCAKEEFNLRQSVDTETIMTRGTAGSI